MPNPDPATVAAGQAIGQNAAVPLVYFLRRQDTTASAWAMSTETTVFGVVRTAGKVTQVSVVPIDAVTADSGTHINIFIFRNGSSVLLWSGTLQAWSVGTETVLSSSVVPTKTGDIFFATFVKGASNIIPSLLFIVQQDIGL